MATQNTRFYSRWLPALIAAMMLVMILVGSLAFQYVEASMVASAGESLTLAAVDIADKLDMLMVERYGDIQVLSQSLDFQAYNYAEMRRRLLSLLEAYPVYRWAGVTDANGRILVATDQTNLGQDLSWEPGFRSVKAGGRAVVQDATSDNDGVLTVTFVSPLRDARGKFLGTVISQIGLPVLEDAFARVVNALQGQWGSGARIEYLFLNHDGEVFVDSFLREEGQINLQQEKLPSALLLNTAPAGFVEEQHGRREVAVVTGYAQTKGTEDIKGLRWGVLVRVDRSDILVPIRTILWKLSAAGTMVGAPLLGLLFWSTNRLQSEYARAQQDNARAQAAEATTRQMMDTMDASCDGLFIFDAETLGFFYVNQGAQMQTGYSREELLAMTPVDIKPTFDEPQFRALLARVRAEPDHALTHTTVHRRKDGADVSVEIVLQYFTPQGQRSHYIAAVRDITERQRAEATLRQSEKRTRHILESALDAFVGMDTDGFITDWNAQAEQIFGWSRQEAIGQHLAATIIPAQYREAHERGLRRFLATGKGSILNQLIEITAHHRDGREFPVELTISATFVSAGRYTFNAFLRDISVRKRAEAALRESEQRLAYALDATSEGLWDWNLQAGAILFSPQWMASLGYSPNEVIPHVDFRTSIIHPDDRLRVQEALQAHFDKRTPLYQCENRLRMKSGHYRENLDRGKVIAWDAEGRPLRMVGTDTDITERKQAERAMRDALTTLDAMMDATFIFDPSTLRFSYVNEGAVLQTGYSREELLRMTPVHIKPKFDEQQFRAMIAPLTSGRLRTYTLRTVHRRKNGEDLPVEINLQCVGIGTAQARFIAIARDITEREQVQQELLAAKELAEASVRAKSEFLATMSHEIRTPMNGVIGMTGLLLDTDLTPDQREFAETVRNSGNHLLTVINDILDFSKIEAGKMDLEIIDFDLRTAVSETVDLLAERAASKGLNLACLFHADVPAALRGDPGRLRQILLNLLGNAVKFTEQGDVVLSISLLDQTATDATVRFEVQDAGIGLSADAQVHLFQSFSQADTSTTRKFGGTGLGLAICKRLTELMGGHIGVESQLGKGSMFWFTAQFGKQPPAPVSMSAPASQDLQGLQLCIVGSNPLNRRILELYAGRWGIRCLVAENGQEALVLLRQAAAGGQACDLAIIDMALSGMDGLELARAIKADSALAPTKLVLLTMQGHRGDAKAAREAGYAAYLSKPVHAPQLHTCLTTILKQYADQTAQPTLVTRHSLAEIHARATPKILLVEDNAVNQKVAVRMLEKLDYRADLAANGLEALDALTRIPYAAVLMDCRMPEMDGLEAAREIRRREATDSWTTRLSPLASRHVPIIAMTANAQKQDQEQCLLAGMDDYLSKPVQFKILAETLARWVSAPDSISDSLPANHCEKLPDGGPDVHFDR